MRALHLTIIIAVCSLFLVSSARAQDWVEVMPTAGPGPSARTLSAAVYDPVAHAMVLIGGEDGGGVRLNDVWSLDLTTNTWTDITPSAGPAPFGRITPAIVYDIDRHQILLFSGQGAGSLFLNDSWGFDLTANMWTQFTPPDPKPTTRYGVATCYDEVGKTQITFAGFTFQGRFDDTWSFDPVTDTWTDVSPVSGSPLERCLHSAVYDSRNRRMIMYGGQNAGPLGDVWAFDISSGTWSELTPASGPDPRWFSTFEYDPANHRATMFSGHRGGSGKANDAWVFDLWSEEWTQLSPSGTPPAARDGAASVYVASEDRMIIFGGESTVVLDDVWALNNLSDTPSGVVPFGRVMNDGAVLHQNYPNPFNPITVIGFELLTAAHVSLTIFDPSGREVRALISGGRPAGYNSVSWDGRNNSGVRVSSGVYVYRLRAADEILTRKMLLLK